MQLAANEVHIWCYPGPRTLDPTLESAYFAMLSQEEIAKVQRYRLPEDRLQSLVSRVMIRTACSHYLGQLDPQQWSFATAAKGKPRLAAKHNCAFNFNISHTNGLIVLALCKNHHVGIDTEHTGRQNDTHGIARRYFAPAEVTQLLQFPQAQQHTRFFDFWTLKESYIKACGQGLAIPLDSFSFNMSRQRPSQYPPRCLIDTNISLEFHQGRQDHATNWQHFLFDLSIYHRSALSIKTHGVTCEPFQLRFFNTLPLRSLEEFQLPLEATLFSDLR